MDSAGVHSLSKSLECAHEYQEVSVASGTTACVYQMFLPRCINK